MPWQPSDAIKHTKRADTLAKQRRWADVANGVLDKTGDDATAIREANAAIAHKVKWT